MNITNGQPNNVRATKADTDLDAALRGAKLVSEPEAHRVLRQCAARELLQWEALQPGGAVDEILQHKKPGRRSGNQPGKT